MLISLAIAASDNNDGSATFTIARSMPTLVGAWPAGAYHELVLPKLPASLMPAGRRFLLLGFEITTAIALGGALFTAGAFTAAFRIDTAPDLKLHASGFTS